MKKYQRYVLSIGLSICLLAPAVSWAESFRLLRNYPDRMPLSFMDGKGQPTGFETELMAEIVKRSGLSLNEEFVPSIRHGLQALREGEADLLVAAVSITEERKKEFDFSEEYFLSRPMIITKDSSIKSFADLADKKVGMIQDSVHSRRSRRNGAGRLDAWTRYDFFGFERYAARKKRGDCRRRILYGANSFFV